MQFDEPTEGDKNDVEDAYELTRRGCHENMAAFAEGDIDYLDQILLDFRDPYASILGDSGTRWKKCTKRS